MKRLTPFNYYEPKTLSEAVRILAGEGNHAYALAGGTDLLVRMKRGEILPSSLINLKGILGLNRVEEEKGKGLRIGALTVISDIERDPQIRRDFPLLYQAAGSLASPAIRNLATLGGNIGRASPASDLAPSLMVLKSCLFVEGLQGKRELDISRFFRGPGQTVLARGEIITSFFLPQLPPHSGMAYLRMGRGEGMDLALVGVAALLTLGGKGKALKEARVALAAVAPVPLLVKKAEEVLLSGPLSEERIREAAKAAAAEACPIDDIRGSAAYRKEMVEVLTTRALQQALKAAQGRRD